VVPAARLFDLWYTLYLIDPDPRELLAQTPRKPCSENLNSAHITV
jgi:hypothetical protein